jgi:adhesin transport system membrane fusion protein
MSDIEFKQLAKQMAGKQQNGSSILLLSVVTLLAIIMLWASVTELDNVVRGSGKTVSEAQNQLVQSSEPGVIRARYANEGDIVSKGDLLFDIDPIDAKTQLDQALKRSAALNIKSIRLRAEVAETIPNFPADLIEVSPASASTELALYRARLDDLSTKEAILEQQRIQKRNEILELKIQFETASNGLNLIRREIATIEPLVRSGLAPETRLITLRREEEDMLGKANTAKSGQARLLSGLDQIDEQLRAERQSYKTIALTDLIINRKRNSRIICTHSSAREPC